jgi:hypothetical protein
MSYLISIRLLTCGVLLLHIYIYSYIVHWFVVDHHPATINIVNNFNVLEYRDLRHVLIN